MDNNKPGLKYLIRINSLKKLFNECLQNEDVNCAYMILYKMRSLHGKVLCLYNRVINLPRKHLFNISCYASTCSVINETIINSEMAINRFIKDNNIDVSTLENKNDEVLSIEYTSSNESEDSKESDNLDSDKVFNKQELPLFNGNLSKEAIQRKNIKKEFKLQSDFTEEIPTLMLFYRPGCPACENTKPEWNMITERITDQFKTTRKLFNIFEIDLSDDSNRNLASLFNIEYVPTIIMMESSTKDNAKIEQIVGMSNKQRIHSFIKDCYSKFIN